jgi:L-iditol 2-dehydrogenase
VQAIMEITDGRGADSVFETVGGSVPTLNQAIEMSRHGSAISVLGLFPEPVTIDATAAMRKELRIEWSNSYSTWQGISEYQTALKILADGKVNADPIITTRYQTSTPPLKPPTTNGPQERSR